MDANLLADYVLVYGEARPGGKASRGRGKQWKKTRVSSGSAHRPCERLINGVGGAGRRPPRPGHVPGEHPVSSNLFKSPLMDRPSISVLSARSSSLNEHPATN